MGIEEDFIISESSISTKIKGYFREAMVSRLTFQQIQALMEQAGFTRVHGAGQNYFKGKPSKSSLVDEYFKGAINEGDENLKIVEAITLFLLKYKDPNPSPQTQNLINELKKGQPLQAPARTIYGPPKTITKPSTEVSRLEPGEPDELRDVFLCHASMDKDDYIRPFLEKLSKEQITYWYDEAEIRWGDSLVGKINEGLRKSRFVLIFLSKNFLERNWPEKELNAALGLEIGSGTTRALPLLIGDDKDVQSILEKYPLLNDKKHERWDKGIDSLIDALKKRLGKSVIKSESVKSEMAQKMLPHRQWNDVKKVVVDKWQKAGVVIAGLGLVWAITSFLPSHFQDTVFTTTQSKTQSIGNIKTGDHSPITVSQQIIDKTDMRIAINPSKIYLSLWETSREIALNQDKIIVPPIYPIKLNEEFVFRVILRQENEDGVYIPHIYITFPETAEVTPDTSDINRSGVWTKNNDTTNTYYLSYLNIVKFYAETAYNLPALRVKVKDAKIPMSYRITVDGLKKSIGRNFVIDTSLDYNTYYKEHFSLNTAERIPELEHAMSSDTSGIFRRIVYENKENNNTATASSTCVSVTPRTLPFVHPFETVKPDMQKSDSSTVSFFSSGDNDTYSVSPLSAYTRQGSTTVTPDANNKK